MAGIVIDKVRKDFGGVTALQEVSLAVADGEFVALLGPSGCGKTTLLRIVAGLETEAAGRILIGDRDIKGLRPAARGLAMVFQNYAVFPHMNVYENIAFGLRMQKKPGETVDRQVKKAAGLLKIEALLERYPGRLSGGQRQRVAVARALAVEPAVLLMDEPLSNLDALLRLEMRAELKAVLRDAGTTTIYVTHDQTEAMGLADRIAVMYGGRIVQIDSPWVVYARPATAFVGGFVGSPPMNFLAATIENGAVRLGAQQLRAPMASGPITVGFRGEDVRLVEPDAGLPLDIRVTEPMGSHLLLTGTAGGATLRVVAAPDAKLGAGDRVGLALAAERVVFMDPASGNSLGGVQ